MKFTHPTKGKIEEVYFTSKDLMRRVFESGKVEMWQLGAGGWSQVQ